MASSSSSERDVTVEERNKAVVRRVFEELLPAPVLTASEVEQLVAPDFVDHDPPDPDRARGIESIVATHQVLHRSHGQVRFTIEEMIAEGDQVAVRWRAGFARAIAWFRLVDGKIAERWALVVRTR
jgi:predicted SnoaL-like aldol condensation-catalyzing enzyme